VGSGFKTFTAGSVLTASDVQNYLQDQAVMVFGGTAARSSAIGTANFEEGMLTYLTDVDKLQVYTGSSFQDVYPPAATSQGMTLINTTSFSGVASQSINDVFTSTYDNYFIILNVTPTGNTNQSFRLRASGSDNSTANYFQTIAGLTTGGAADNFTGTGATRHDIGRSNSGNPFAFHLNIFNPQKNVFTSYTQIGQSNDSASLRINHMGSGSFGTTAQFDGITFFPTSAVNITGSISIYGYNK
jgi:hypothetical protein